MENIKALRQLVGNSKEVRFFGLNNLPENISLPIGRLSPILRNSVEPSNKKGILPKMSNVLFIRFLQGECK